MGWSEDAWRVENSRAFRPVRMASSVTDNEAGNISKVIFALMIGIQEF